MAGVEMGSAPPPTPRRTVTGAAPSPSSAVPRSQRRPVNRQSIAMVLLMLLIAGAAVSYGVVSRQPDWVAYR